MIGGGGNFSDLDFFFGKLTMPQINEAGVRPETPKLFQLKRLQRISFRR